MKRKEALIALLDAVKEGGCDASFMRLAENAFPIDARFLQGKAWDAYNGSLNAALALHKAVLPGWEWAVASGATGCRAAVQKDYGYQGRAKCPARAWLIAILNALIAEADA